jgi:hypothetical protein
MIDDFIERHVITACKLWLSDNVESVRIGLIDFFISYTDTATIVVEVTDHRPDGTHFRTQVRYEVIVALDQKDIDKYVFVITDSHQIT